MTKCHIIGAANRKNHRKCRDNMGRPKNGINQKRTCEEKVKLIEEYYASEIGYKAFAQNHGIAPSLFYSWIRKYNEGGINSLRYKKRKNDKPSTAQIESEEIIRLKLIIAEQQLEILSLKNKDKVQ